MSKKKRIPVDEEFRKLPTGGVIRAVYWKSLGAHELNGREIGLVGFFVEGKDTPAWVGTDWHYRDETPEENAELYGVPIIEA